LFFGGKLQFLSNYFARASDGGLTVTGTVLPTVITLDDTMAAYSPQTSQGNAPLAYLFIDSWTRAVAQQPVFPFDQYDAFVIFHAGAGRDVDLVSLLGYDPTPNDIPSVYVNLSSLREFLGDPGFEGVEVPGTGFFITNSLILPETESRVLDTGFGRDTLKLSINGITAATMGSHLGLPDLFDVNTGRSGIGQFGLMDGAGIFAYNGLFPPEPSAWEKYHLGWITPIQVPSTSGTIVVPAVGLVESGRDTVYRISISPKEYYLIENRQRDAQGNGQTLTVVQNGVPVDFHFQGDTAGFSFDDISAIQGSVIDVEDLDWATPGSTLQEGFEGGGILIWHIDESIIDATIAENNVNADPARRGVDLEEADGSQDIGQPYEFLQPGSGTEFGWPLDLWFESNESPVYVNRFDGTSHPNTLSNTGAKSLIAVRDFGERSARMGLTVEVGSSELQVIQGLQRVLARGDVSAAPTVSSSGIYMTHGDTVYAFNVDGSSKTASPNGFLSSKGGRASVTVLERGGGRTLVSASHDSSLMVWELIDSNGDNVFESVTEGEASIGVPLSTPPSFLVGASQFAVAVGTTAGSYALVDSLLIVSVIPSGVSAAVTQMTQLPSLDPDSLPAVYALAGTSIFTQSRSITIPADEDEWSLSGFVSSGGKRVLAVGRSGSRMLLFDEQLSPVSELTMAADSLRGMSIADLDGDGMKEIVLAGESGVRAFNESGSLADGFPVGATAGSAFSSSPMVADLDGDGSPDVLIGASDGVVSAVTARGVLLPGYPVQGFEPGTTRLGVFQGPGGNVGFLGLTMDGSVKAFETSAPYRVGSVLWSQELGDAYHRNADLSTTQNPIPINSQFFPASRVYNWPNPVYGDETQIRYYVAEDAVISVKIFDLTGIKITELTAAATGGLDGEVSWNVRDVQSGVYLARVEAVSQSRNDVAVIKIAIVK
jgi:hypothetical protein